MFTRAGNVEISEIGVGETETIRSLFDTKKIFAYFRLVLLENF